MTTEPWTGVIPTGKHVRQGDVYLCNESKPECGKLLADDNDKEIQLAPGNTRGSRHVLKMGKGIKVFAPKQTSEFVGVVIRVDEGAIATINHPTHRQFNVQGPCDLQVRFPMDHSDPRQLRRRTRSADQDPETEVDGGQALERGPQRAGVLSRPTPRPLAARTGG